MNFTIKYTTANCNGNGINEFFNIIENAPSEVAVRELFDHLMDGGSKIVSLEPTKEADNHRRIPYRSYGEKK